MVFELKLNTEDEIPNALAQLYIETMLSFDNAEKTDSASRVLDVLLSSFYVVSFCRIKDTPLAYYKECDVLPDPEMIARLDSANRLLCDLLEKSHQEIIHCTVSKECSLLIRLHPKYLSMSREEIYSSLNDELAQAADMVREQLGSSIQIISSTVSVGQNDIPHAYRVAWYSIDLLFKVYKTDIITFNTVRTDNAPDTSLLAPKLEWERLFLDAILEKNFPKANNLMQELLQRELHYTNSALSIRYRLRSRLSWVACVLGVPVNETILDCAAIYDDVKKIISCKTDHDLSETIEDFFNRLARYYQKSIYSAKDKVRFIQKYIQDNYADQILSVTSICERFSISNGHLSRVFKAEVGINVIDYIHNVRVRKAKELIASSDMTFNDIALQVGYTGEWTLRRAFKRYEGLSPSNARQYIRQK